MSEQSKPIEQNQNPTNQPTNWKGNAVSGLRFIQVFALAMVAVGFIWGLGDWINSFLPAGSSAPIYVLLMLYGLVGSAMVEVPIRVLQRKK